MSLDKATVAKIARLARLKAPAQLLEPMTGELNTILKFVEQLSEIDTKGVPPMTSVVAMNLRMRADAVTDSPGAEDILANAPERAEDFFVVPKVVE
ncbi:MAG TPA: Asp-tRNA(Asn)/Glu-tRNA(Gln) amidotransferase subunit GatC [Candidatus Cybelea sp.]|nr:Asp-tRNA(Asn)/Glu-tRNA(Gln) amidotransferase subunit GatC [Candidatus Cybelea sp.]